MERKRMFDLNQFIGTVVTKRSQSMFLEDIENNKEEIRKRVEDKSILVVGGAGSIGSSFIKAILPFKPKSLVVVDYNENALAELTRDLRSTKGLYIPSDYSLYPFDFASPIFEKMFRCRRGFDIVGNFSAHKHVRSEKDIYSIEALIQNNILHMKHFLDLLLEFSPEAFFGVSSDKAANPVNVMGASKRIMEDVIFSYSDYFPVKTARFANVAFSNGSLPDSFLKRLQKQQPISAPSDVKRYFVSQEEAGHICLLSCMLGGNREIFFPKLEERQMMSFDKIAEELIKAYGYKVLKCASDSEALVKAEELKNGSRYYPVHFSLADTSGEKSFEEFLTDTEIEDSEMYISLGVIINKQIPNKAKVDKLFSDLNYSFRKEHTSKEEIIEIMRDYLPNFNHIETGRTLDEKM